MVNSTELTGVYSHQTHASYKSIEWLLGSIGPGVIFPILFYLGGHVEIAFCLTFAYFTGLWAISEVCLFPAKI